MEKSTRKTAHLRISFPSGLAAYEEFCALIVTDTRSFVSFVVAPSLNPESLARTTSSASATVTWRFMLSDGSMQLPDPDEPVDGRSLPQPDPRDSPVRQHHAAPTATPCEAPVLIAEPYGFGHPTTPAGAARNRRRWFCRRNVLAYASRSTYCPTLTSRAFGDACTDQSESKIVSLSTRSRSVFTQHPIR